MLEDLKISVCDVNLELVKRGAVIYTWGNVSGISSDGKYMVIKPSGVEYDKMSPDDMVVVDIESGLRVEGKWNPSSDTKTHLALYRKFKSIKGIVHTHSVNAVAFAPRQVLQFLRWERLMQIISMVIFHALVN